MSEMNGLPIANAGESAYQDTVRHGYYGMRIGGLFGKYDNVRSFWEDQYNREVIRPHLRTLVESARAAERGIRILDMGCGAGQGYELLMGIEQSDISLEVTNKRVMTREDVALYYGIDLSPAMIDQGRQNYEGQDHMRFEVADLRDGLDSVRDEPAFDLYYSSYGSLSHLDYGGVKNLFTDIADHASDGSLIVMDMIGRYSLEWPQYWADDRATDNVHDYSLSYMYTPEQRKLGNIDKFRIRFWSGADIHRVCQELTSETGVTFTPLSVCDRSLLVGRHVDTNEYGTPLPPLRSVVNQLHEDYHRTHLKQLLVDFTPIDGQPELNEFFGTLVRGWNELIQFTLGRLYGERFDMLRIDGWQDFPAAVQVALMSMDRVVDSVAWMRFGDARANIIEPQIGYLLRYLENNLQRGMGAGHGLLGVLRVNK